MARIPIKIKENENVKIKFNNSSKGIKFNINNKNDIDIKFDENSEKTKINFDDKVKIDYEYYNGPYEVTPRAYNKIILETDNKLMKDDVLVNEVPYYETSNISGNTVYIANVL